MKDNPRILVVNDDGVDAPGFSIALEIARALSSDVWGVAPAHNQSGAGHRFTLGRELSAEPRGDNVFAIDGSPADCVVIGCTHLLADKLPDIVLSGVNAGQNLGDIINCSGTIAGAREGALQGALGIALSQGVNYEAQRRLSWDVAKAHGLQVVRDLIAEAEGHATYFNINFPFCEPEEVAGVRVVPHQRFSRSPFRHVPSDNAGKFFVAIPGTPGPLDHAADFYTLMRGHAITLTPLTLEQSDHAEISRLEGRLNTATIRPE